MPGWRIGYRGRGCHGVYRNPVESQRSRQMDYQVAAAISGSLQSLRRELQKRAAPGTETRERVGGLDNIDQSWRQQPWTMSCRRCSRRARSRSKGTRAPPADLVGPSVSIAGCLGRASSGSHSACHELFRSGPTLAPGGGAMTTGGTISVNDDDHLSAPIRGSYPSRRRELPGRVYNTAAQPTFVRPTCRNESNWTRAGRVKVS